MADIIVSWAKRELKYSAYSTEEPTIHALGDTAGEAMSKLKKFLKFREECKKKSCLQDLLDENKKLREVVSLLEAATELYDEGYAEDAFDRFLESAQYAKHLLGSDKEENDA